MEKVIQITGLTKRYGNFTAVDDLNLSVARGEIFGLLGPNGAGKSTTILMLMGLSEPDAGAVTVCGIDPIRFPINVKRKVGYLPEEVGFYDDFSGMENLVYTARLNEIPEKEAKERASVLLDRVGLADEMDKKCGKYSRGMRQRLGLADVLIKNPEVIILDEPTLGIDPAGVREFLELIVKLSREDGITVLFSSHHLHQVQQVCDRVGIFVKGKLLAEGDINSLAKKLFSVNTFTIEGDIVSLDETGNGGKTGQISITELVSNLQGIKGVANVKIDNNHFQIESDSDISARISRVILDSGYALNTLNKKEYGLDDIFYQYFSGGGNNHG